MRSVVAAALVGLALPTTGQAAETMNSWSEIRAAFVRCWSVPSGTEGSTVSFQFMLSPNGGLRGPPRVLAKVLKGDDRAKKAYETAAYAALDKCLPFTISPSFRMMMGESIILLRFVNTPREPSRNMGTLMTIFAAEAAHE